MAIVQRELNYLPALRRPTHRGWAGVSRMVVPAFLILAVFVAYVLINTLVAWGQVKLDDIRYGYPRTSSTDGYMGYREQTGVPTHFIVVNAHRQVLIMIMPGGDPSHVLVIKGPYLFGPGEEFSPATLDLIDSNHDGYPDLRLHVAGQTLVYLNNPRSQTFTLAHQANGGVR
ncbi:MAG TPA: hypothetical protein VNL71_15515 [Chloroflexota bacterium]|nr:hypothetical protein [Chloroflexota bacterium]